MNIARRLFCLGLGLLLPSLAGWAGEQQVDNGAFRVVFNDAAARLRIEMPDGAGGARVVASEIGLAECGPGSVATVAEVFHPQWGRGQALVVTPPSGGTPGGLVDRASIVVYPGQPFAFVSAELRNREKATPRIVERLELLRGFALPDVPVAELKTLGTGGLLEVKANPGSYAYLAIAQPATPHGAGLVAGWLTHDRGSGVLFSGASAGQATFSARSDYGRLRLRPGAKMVSETLVFGWFADVRLGLEGWADTVATASGLQNRRPQPAGYCTWYSRPHGGASDAVHLRELAQFCGLRLKPYGFNFVQIDDGWQTGTRRNGPAKDFLQANQEPGAPYAEGMKAIADQVKMQGLTPGIWFMPFAGDPMLPLFQENPDWFVKREDGSLYETAWGGTSLDLTQPQVRSYLRQLVRRISTEWGYGYFKMDGLYTGLACKQVYVNRGYVEDGFGDARLANTDITQVEAFRSGLSIVRDEAGPNVFLLGCCLPQNMRSFEASMGLVDAMRIGADNNAEWKNQPEGALLTGPIHGSNLYFLHRRLWYNDPDPVYLRASVPLVEVRTLCSWVGFSSQLNVVSDWLPEVPAERLDLFTRTIPAHSLQARPVDWLESSLPTIWTATDTRFRTDTPRQLVAFFNWDDQPKAFAPTLEKLGLPQKNPGSAWICYEFWSNTVVEIVDGKLAQVVAPRDCAIFALRQLAPQPQLLSTNRHLMQGGVDSLDERWTPAQILWMIDRAGKGTLSGRSAIVGKEPYELRILEKSTQGPWKLLAASVSPEDAAAGATIAVKEEKDGLARVVITAPDNREVNWSIDLELAD